MDFKIKISIASGSQELQTAFGPGIAELLRRVEDSGSLNKAAKEMHMAYSKAWKLVRAVEATLEVPLLNRDGARGSALTPEGKKMLACFLEMEEAAYQAAGVAFREHYGNH